MGWRVPDGRYQIGVGSGRTSAAGAPLAIPDAGVTQEEDCLTRWEIVGHYLYPPENGE